MSRCPLAIASASAVLAGCAALQIDVDVYKGPLANHEDVQVRQYAALAVASRPVLAALRNRFEEAASPGFGQRLRPVERDDFIVDRTGTRFRSDTARFINGALSFYHDAEETAATPVVSRLRRAAARLRSMTWLIS